MRVSVGLLDTHDPPRAPGVGHPPPRPHRPPPRLGPDTAAGLAAGALPLFLHPHTRTYRSKASAQLGPAGFARIDAVYRHGRDAACRWLSTRPAPGPAAVSHQNVQLFLT